MSCCLGSRCRCENSTGFEGSSHAAEALLYCFKLSQNLPSNLLARVLVVPTRKSSAESARVCVSALANFLTTEIVLESLSEFKYCHRPVACLEPKCVVGNVTAVSDTRSSKP